jgi:putative transposase
MEVGVGRNPICRAKNWRSPQVHTIREEKAPRFQSETWATREMTYYERNLPHWHPAGKSIFVTWRLFGSLPRTVGARIKSSGNASGKRFLVFDECLDSAKCGPLWLLDGKIAGYVRDALIRGAELGQYRLHAWVIMPNHVHVLLEPLVALQRVMSTLKGVSARNANAELGRVGEPFWQDESFDHWIRDSSQFERIRSYIEQNPVKAGLAKKPEDWLWSSARK